MAALWNRAGHYIFALWFLSFVLSFSRLISAVRDWMSTILRHMVWKYGATILPHMVWKYGANNANLECMSEMCCTRLAENTGCKN